MRNFILGTDWWDDCDDAVALRLLTRHIKEQRINLQGVVINACMEHSVASLKGFLLADGVSGVPVGIDRDATDFGGIQPYQRRLAEAYCPDVTNDDGEDPVRLYRRLLAESDGRVEIAEIGFLQVIAAVLESGADDISPKSGVELFEEKVAKVWVMAGKWDEEGGLENNFWRNARSRVGAATFCRMCPVPVTFLGFEVGEGVISGSRLDHADHLYDVLVDHGSQDGRHSWDPMLILMALIGDEAQAGYDTVAGYASVDPETGRNYFAKDPAGPHRFVVKKFENSYYENAIDRFIKEMEI